MTALVSLNLAVRASDSQSGATVAPGVSVDTLVAAASASRSFAFCVESLPRPWQVAMRERSSIARGACAARCESNDRVVR